MGWEKTGREILHRGQYVTLWRDTVVQPDGTPGVYEHIEVSDGVRVVALDERRRVLLVEDDFYLKGSRVLHLPGGGVGGQAPDKAALRELEEETGYTAEHLISLGAIDPLPSTASARTTLFLATDLRQGTVRRDATEIGMTTSWWDFDDAVQAVRSGRITEAGSASALLLAALDPRTS